jgi:Skp family chaperone for outer membrane proteins
MDIHSEEQAMRRRNEITATILDALQTPNRPVQSETTRTTFVGTAIADNAAYISVANVLAASDGLSKEYERLNSTIKDIGEEYTEPVAEMWQQELRDTEQQLQMGARVALRNVRKVLGADVDMGKGADEDGEEQEQNDGDAEHELNYELQRSLRYVERGVKRMVKGLPNEE